MEDPQAEQRAAARRRRATLRRTSLHEPHGGLDDVVRGEEALSLVTRLTREGWSLAGLPLPDYERADIPVRFVPRDSA